MYLKHIICQVKPINKQAFSSAQEKWVVLKEIPGFLAQFGGWIGNEAHIISLWNSKSAYELFMKDQHDQITKNIQQHQSYVALKIEYYEYHNNTHHSGIKQKFIFNNEQSIREFFIKLKNNHNINLMEYHQQMIFVIEWNIR